MERASRDAGMERASRDAFIESALRALSFALIAFALWRMLAGAGTGATVRVRSSSLERELPSIESARTSALHVDIDVTPAPADRDALAAVAHAGTRVTWSAAAMTPLAAVAERTREPGGPVRIAVASLADVAFSDGLAALDTVRAASATHGAMVGIGAPSGALRVRSGSARATVGVPSAAALHAVLVVGRAGWEAKFAVAALEEQGWTVEERLFVAPGADVTQGSIGAIDTTHFSAIVALDTALGSVGPGIVRFVRQGGGLVLLADAANAAAVRAIAPARAGTRRLADTRAFDVAEPVNAMPVYPLDSPRADAVRLSMRGSLLTAAARREGAGRVLQAGFDETWRWRMQGGADALAAHRAWWSRMVASVAVAPLAAVDETPAAEGAPLARLVDALGPAVTIAPDASGPHRLPVWLLPAILLCLLAEWGSRRWRGAQ
jgi:hypothetical protein